MDKNITKTIGDVKNSIKKEENDCEFYVQLFFDVNRGGFSDIAENILSCLDYASFVNFKRTCKLVYQYIISSNIEQLKFHKKLRNDWKFGTHKERSFNVPGLVSSSQIFANSSKIVSGVDEMIVVSDTASGERLLDLRGHNSVITCVDVFTFDSKDYIVSGCQDGVLAIWSLEGHEQDDCLCQKQLFGRIEVVKAKNNFLVTAHFGKFYDAGCISVRKINSPVDLPVIFSIYEDLFPIFCMDFSDTHLAVLEWSGTFNNVHSGNVVIFKWMNPEPFANLSDLTFTCCRFIEPTGHLITGGHDKMIRLWELSDSRVQCIRTIGGHSNVIVRLVLSGSRAASRDLDGNILIWDLNDALTQNYNHEEYEKILLRRVKSVSRTVTCIALDERKLVMGAIGHFSVFDYWNTAKHL